jgi:hypothetical protein
LAARPSSAWWDGPEDEQAEVSPQRQGPEAQEEKALGEKYTIKT